MATSSGVFLSIGISALHRRNMTSSAAVNHIPILSNRVVSTGGGGGGGGGGGEVAIKTKITIETTPSLQEAFCYSDNELEKSDEEASASGSANYTYLEESARKSLKDYFEETLDFIKYGSGNDNVPRWFSLLECGPPSDNSPLLFYLPGIDGVGLGLIRQHHRLRKIFDVWCLHIPVNNRTQFQDLVELVERTVRSENYGKPDKPIYLVGDSLGGCLALNVAARNPDIDIVLILSNPATCFGKSLLQPLFTLLHIVPDELQFRLPYILNLFSGDPSKTVTKDVVNRLILQHIFGLPQELFAISSYVADVAHIVTKETLIWKLKLLRSASEHANAHLRAVKAQTLIFSSGMDQLLPSREEAIRLWSVLPNCEVRNFANSGHFLFLEDGVDMMTIIKAACFYRRRKYHDPISDFLPPTPSDFNKAFEWYRWLTALINPVMLSTLEDGEIVRGLAGIPCEGPVLYVGYHMLMGLELPSMISRVLTEKNILIRGMAHPMIFKRTENVLLNIPKFDSFKLMGAVPVTASNFYRLMSSKSHALLYPGGTREALHRKGEEYELFWPEQSEFIRMAARFGAKIVPFGVVGEDDLTEVVYDYDDLMKNPIFRDQIEEFSKYAVHVRSPEDGEVANQNPHIPLIAPKLPGRFYYCFGKPIETAGRKEELKDKMKAHELYIEVKSEVERLIAYLKEKREHDPYRSIVDRLPYQATHDFTSDVPTFEL
ncbi:hypothetical protein ACFE04_007804 [Oxalis oulophora]